MPSPFKLSNQSQCSYENLSVFEIRFHMPFTDIETSKCLVQCFFFSWLNMFDAKKFSVFEMEIM